MNRRDFLVGLFGSAAIVSLPIKTLEVAIADDVWQEAIGKIFDRYFKDFVIYGSAAIGPSPEFPYIRNIPFEEWTEVPETYPIRRI